MYNKAWRPIGESKPIVEPTLWAVVEEEDRLYLAVVHKDGSIIGAGRVIEIKPNGSLERCGAVTDKVGLALSFGHKIVVD